MPVDSPTQRLGQLPKGEEAVIVGIDEFPLKSRFLELGFLTGETVAILHQAPFGGDPVAVRVRGSLIAMRRDEADRIQVTRKPGVMR